METAEAEKAQGAMSKVWKIKQEQYNQKLFFIYQCLHGDVVIVPSVHTLGGGDKETHEIWGTYKDI